MTKMRVVQGNSPYFKQVSNSHETFLIRDKMFKLVTLKIYLSFDISYHLSFLNGFNPLPTGIIKWICPNLGTVHSKVKG
jgi:hypothetical protein